MFLRTKSYPSGWRARITVFPRHLFDYFFLFFYSNPLCVNGGWVLAVTSLLALLLWTALSNWQKEWGSVCFFLMFFQIRIINHHEFKKKEKCMTIYWWNLCNQIKYKCLKSVHWDVFLTNAGFWLQRWRGLLPHLSVISLTQLGLIFIWV